MGSPLLSKYELHPADRLIHHRGKREEVCVCECGGGDMEGTKRNVQKMERGRECEERWEE